MKENGSSNSANNPKEAPLVLIVSQLVQDIKVGGGRLREQLMREVGRLRNGLISKAYIPADKLNAIVEPLYFRDGQLVVDIHGGMLRSSDYQASLDTHIHHALPLDMKDNFPANQNLASTTFWDFLLSYCNDVHCDAGGNAQNMAVNICLAGISSALRNKIRVTLLSSSDPFRLMPDDVQETLKENFNVHLLEGLPDRYAVQMPWKIGAEHGSFALTTEPADLSPIIKKLLETREDIQDLFKQADCFVASDPSFEFFRSHGKAGKYCIIVNAATKWRTLIANRTYGTNVILPMNHAEASDVLGCMEQAGTDTELHKIKRSPFPSPFKPNGINVDDEQLSRVDTALSKLSQFNPPYQRSGGKMAFNYPITAEADGGLVVGTRELKSIVAFTTTVHPDKEEQLFEEFGEPSQCSLDKIQTMGAGDAAAAIIAIFNTIDPSIFLEQFLQGEEKRKPALLHYACTIFVSALSRIVGNFLIRTPKCHWNNIPHDKFGSLFSNVAEESLNVARNMMSQYGNYHLAELPKWGIRVVVWRLGSISKPEENSMDAY